MKKAWSSSLSISGAATDAAYAGTPDERDGVAIVRLERGDDFVPARTIVAEAPATQCVGGVPAELAPVLKLSLIHI